MVDRKAVVSVVVLVDWKVVLWVAGSADGWVVLWAITTTSVYDQRRQEECYMGY